MNITFRRALPQDWQAIQKLNDEVMVSNSAYDAYMHKEYAYTQDGEKYYKEVTSNSEYICILAEDNGKPVGYLAGSHKNLTYRTVKIMELNDMGVSPEYRSQGIGSLLVAELKRIAKSEGYQTIYVNSYFKNTKAIEFYKKQGFEPIDLSLEMTLD
jgi:ribosomal protein S18 acetylase RimI-like enzyme